MDSQKHELVEKLKGANNILVTVSANPSVDQLAACIGLTLLLNKLKKHATAVFSGTVPSTIEFLKPEDTIEKNTDSLRDFIISLDKSKADKLRYKVEENIVKIFITPYKTSINQDDLDFSQGDFNVDVVLCLGISQQQDLDQAITAHGRILHDAVVTSINIQEGSALGSINWTNTGASSLSELAVELTDELGQDLLDAQIATALLTGIVAETERFSNEKTTPGTMKLSAELMTAGANQQLVANELQPEEPDAPEIQVENIAPATSPDGMLEVAHLDQEPLQTSPLEATALPNLEYQPVGDTGPDNDPEFQPASRLMLQAPSMGGQLTANSQPEVEDPTVDPLTMLGIESPILNHGTQGSADDNQSSQPPDVQANPFTPTTPNSPQSTDSPASEPAPLVLPEIALPTSEVKESEELAAPVDAVSEEPAFEALPSEPVEKSTVPTAAEPPASGQVLIDADGNLALPADPLASIPADASTQTQPPTDDTTTVNNQTTPATDATGPDAAAARDALAAIYSSSPSDAPQPKADIGASGYLQVQDLPGLEGNEVVADVELPSGAPPPSYDEPAPNSASPADQPMNMPLPPSLTPPPADPTPPTSTTSDATAPPPVPPPF